MSPAKDVALVQAYITQLEDRYKEARMSEVLLRAQLDVMQKNLIAATEKIEELTTTDKLNNVGT